MKFIYLKNIILTVKNNATWGCNSTKPWKECQLRMYSKKYRKKIEIPAAWMFLHVLAWPFSCIPYHMIQQASPLKLNSACENLRPLLLPQEYTRIVRVENPFLLRYLGTPTPVNGEKISGKWSQECTLPIVNSLCRKRVIIAWFNEFQTPIDMDWLSQQLFSIICLFLFLFFFNSAVLGHNNLFPYEISSNMTRIYISTIMPIYQVPIT